MWWQSVGVGRRQTVGRKLSIECRERTRPPLGLPSSRVPRSQGGNATQGHSPPFTLTHFASLCGKCVSTMQLLEPKAPRAQRIARSISNAVTDGGVGCAHLSMVLGVGTQGNIRYQCAYRRCFFVLKHKEKDKICWKKHYCTPKSCVCTIILLYVTQFSCKLSPLSIKHPSFVAVKRTHPRIIPTHRTLHRKTTHTFTHACEWVYGCVRVCVLVGL